MANPTRSQGNERNLEGRGNRPGSSGNIEANRPGRSQGGQVGSRRGIEEEE